MVKPILPREISMNLPVDVIRSIYSFVPHMPNTPSPKTSPSLQKELIRIQTSSLIKKSAMFMYELVDFVLD
jgi:hypothetical protein